MRLAVVDNDPARSAEDVVSTENEASGRAILYAAEPCIGIPHARNRAIELCLESGADWLVFIDDDALAAPDWIDGLKWAVAEYDADVIAGPVDNPLPEPAPFWAAPRPKRARAEGEAIPAAPTNNVAVRARVFREHPSIRFDTDMCFTGGSDTDFFRRLGAAGAVMRWSNRPRVSEPVPPERLTFRWQMARKYRTACNDIHVYRKLRPVPALYARRGMTALWRLLNGGIVLGGATVLFPLWPGRIKKAMLRGGFDIFWALGTLAGMLGRSPQPYRPDRIRSSAN